MTKVTPADDHRALDIAMRLHPEGSERQYVRQVLAEAFAEQRAKYDKLAEDMETYAGTREATLAYSRAAGFIKEIGKR